MSKHSSKWWSARFCATRSSPGERLFASLVLVASQACERSRAVPVMAAAAANPEIAGPSQLWLEGKLPREVNDGRPVPGGTLQIRAAIEPVGLNLLNERQRDGTAIHYLNGPVYETLMEVDREDHPRYRMKPLLAEGYSQSRSKLVQVLRLRKGVRFHNGQPFTSKDVKAVFDAVLNSQNPTSSLRSFFTDLVEYKAPRPHTLILKWRRSSYLAFRSIMTELPIVPASTLQGDFDASPLNRAPIGTGPFRVASWEKNKAITLVNSDAYWGTKAHLEKVIVRFVKDHTAATQMFERGEFDLMTLIQPTVWRAMEKVNTSNAWAFTGYNRIYFLENNYSWIGWNENRPFFKDARVRRALAMLFPFDEVRRNIDLGLDIPTTCPFYYESAYCDPNVKRIDYDPAAAKRVLAEAGWKDTNGDGILDKDGIPFRFSLMVSAHSVRVGKIAALLENEYRKVGIAMDIDRAEWPNLTSRVMKHDFDAVCLLWTHQDVEQDNFMIFHSSQLGGYNYVSYQNPEVDRVLVEARSSFDETKRVELGRELHRRIYGDQVYNFISVRPILDAAKKRVHGIRPSIAWYDLRNIWLEQPEQAQK